MLSSLSPSKSGPASWVSSSLVTLSALTPWIFLIGLYALSWRAQSLIGHWPVYLADDPKYIGSSDGLYQLLLSLLYWIFWGWWIAPYWFAISVWRAGRHVPQKWLRILTVALIVGLCVVVLEPGQRFMWFVD